MNTIEAIILFLASTGVLGLISIGSVWLLKKSTESLLKKELNKHKSKLSKELESYKRELDLKYEHALSLQDRRRKLFEELSDSLEEIYKTEGDELSLKMNKLFGLLALYAPDDVYISLSKSLEGKTVPNEVKPQIYSSLRKSLFGDETELTEDDLIKHIGAKHIKLDEDDS